MVHFANMQTVAIFRFDAVKNLKPTTFWGLSRQNIKFKVSASGDRLGALEDQEISQDALTRARAILLDATDDDEFMSENDEGE